MLNDLLMREEIRFLLLLTSPVLLIATLLLLFWLIGRLRSGGKQRSWQQTTGHVLGAEVKDDGDNGYYPEVVYEYTVDGKRYEGDRLALGLVMTLGSRDIIEAQIVDYPPGKPVTVFYNPRNPSRATLNMDARSNNALLFGAVLIFVIVGIVFGVWILAADPDSFLQPILEQFSPDE